MCVHVQESVVLSQKQSFISSSVSVDKDLASSLDYGSSVWCKPPSLPSPATDNKSFSRTLTPVDRSSQTPAKHPSPTPTPSITSSYSSSCSQTSEAWQAVGSYTSYSTCSMTSSCSCSSCAVTSSSSSSDLAVYEVKVIFVRSPDDCCPRCCDCILRGLMCRQLETTSGGRLWYRWRCMALSLVEHRYFETLIIVMILASSLALVGSCQFYSHRRHHRHCRHT